MIEWLKEWGFLWLFVVACVIALLLLFVNDYEKSTRAEVYCASIGKYPVQTGNDYICVPGESVK